MSQLTQPLVEPAAGERAPARAPVETLAPDPLEPAIDRHNARIGSRVQRAVHIALWCYLIGPLLHPLLRLLFRVRVVGGERLGAVRGPALFPTQHFYEWDSFLVWFAFTWPRAVRQWNLVPVVFVGRAWLTTRARRALAWACGMAGVMRGRGCDQSAFARARDLGAGRMPPCFIMFPTGPIGRARRGAIRPGAAHLAGCVPGVAVYPTAVAGLQELVPRDVVRLRRPRITLVVGEPFRVAGMDPDDDEFVASVSGRIRSGWERGGTRLDIA